jgi:hypothetical protein
LKTSSRIDSSVLSYMVTDITVPISNSLLVIGSVDSELCEFFVQPLRVKREKINKIDKLM